MNSAEDTQQNGINNEEPTSSKINADTNANPNTPDQSKGAIPKSKLVTKGTGSSSKKSVKLNNNIEDMPTMNCVNSSDIIKRNCYSKRVSVPNNYLNNSCDLIENKAEPLCSQKDVCGDHYDYDFRTSLNIPLDTSDFLNVSYLQLHTPGTSSVDQSVSYKEQNVPLFSSGICREQNCLHLRNDSDSSSDDNELLSVSDDGCIYTYKADNAADLPSSFFNLDIPPLENLEALENNRQGNSSPEMDFLEMDFDPGPSGDADSDCVPMSEPAKPSKLPLKPKDNHMAEPKPCCSKYTNKYESPAQSNNMESNNSNNYDKYSKIVKQVCVNNSSSNNSNNIKKNTAPPNVQPIKSEVKMPWSCSLSERTQSAPHLRSIKRHHSSKGELVSPSEFVPSPSGDATISNLSSFHNAMGKILMDEKSSISEDTEKIMTEDNSLSASEAEKIMIWSEQEACLKQITQIAASSCGATAVLNVLNALRIPLPSTEEIQQIVNTRFRANTAPLAEYLLSRSKAGCNHRDIIAGLYKASSGQVYSRFFSMYPERVVNLNKWLGYWIKQGAVPIATLNLQKCQGRIPDSWHHQMIFGIGPKGVYLTNPMECVEPSHLWPQLCSESVLLIRREDVLSRWNHKSDMQQLIKIDDVRWKEINVVGQTAKLVRESRREVKPGSTVTSHLKIPAQYRSGITLAIDIKSPAFSLLRKCPELPLLYPNDTAGAF